MSLRSLTKFRRDGHFTTRSYAWLMAVCLCLPSMGIAQDENRVVHELGLSNDREQVILVRSRFPVGSPITELIMPNWTPGSYMIQDFSANVNGLSAQAADGSVLGLRKTGKDRWQVDTSQVNQLIVSYEVFTPKLGVRTSWASRDFSLINGASVFLYTEESRDQPQLLEISVDASRGEIFTDLPTASKTNAYSARNYDELVDSPVAIAQAPSYRFSVDNQDYVLVNVGENRFWDGPQAAQDVAKIVEETQSFWQENPLERPYWFLNFAVGGGGGLEHDHSTVMMTGRWQIRDREEYIKWLGLVAHEFFYVWNIRRMRPAELADYDYQNEQYSQQLWLAEGLSSYYDNLLLSRAGLVDLKEYLGLLAKSMHRLETTPGRYEQSVTESSFDAWIRHYRPNGNSLNSTISYYTKGALIGFVLDSYLRQNSKGRRNLDQVMRRMYQLYSDKPYDSNAFINVVGEIGGDEAVEFTRSMLNSTGELDVDTALAWFGLVLIRPSETISTDAENKPTLSGYGAVWDKKKPGLIVKTVLVGSAGAAGGLMTGDEVLAIGGERLTVENQESLMRSFVPGEKTELLVSRRGKIVSLDITLDAGIPEKFEIKLRSGYRQSHIKRLENWSGQYLR